jgi:hypothetical protein
LLGLISRTPDLTLLERLSVSVLWCFFDRHSVHFTAGLAIAP